MTPRLESIEEMTVQTEQLDMNQGFGQASMQINFVTRRGGNAFHGRVFEDFRKIGTRCSELGVQRGELSGSGKSTRQEPGEVE